MTPPAPGANEAAPVEGLVEPMSACRRNRLYALEMCLRARRTTDPALRGHYEALSELWLSLAEWGESR